MTSTAYHSSLTGALAREHVDDLLHDAAAARQAKELPPREPHKTPRRRPLWWLRGTGRPALA
jgi:hypothetical protein